jgi:hypothetical protein
LRFWCSLCSGLHIPDQRGGDFDCRSAYWRDLGCFLPEKGAVRMIYMELFISFFQVGLFVSAAAMRPCADPKPDC